MKLIDWFCKNCGFMGKRTDRGLICCDQQQVVDADSYYWQRKGKIRKAYRAWHIDPDGRLCKHFPQHVHSSV